MIINKIDNYYIIKLPSFQIDVYDLEVLEELTKKIIQKTDKKYKLNNSIYLEIYTNDNYGIIVKLKDYKLPFNISNDKTVKITINNKVPFLYQIDYFDIDKNTNYKKNIYYYKKKFYLELTNSIDKLDYLKLLELGQVIYEDTDDIINNGIKI